MTPEELEATVRQAVTPGFRERLLAKGQARSIIWRDGELPEGAPHFPRRLSYDLLSYGYALLSLAIEIRERHRDLALSRDAFERAASALEAIVARGNPRSRERGFQRVLAAAAFHLARYSARAFSLFTHAVDDANLSPMERGLALLILRSFDELEELISLWCTDGAASDEALVAMLGPLLDAAVGEGDGDDQPPYLEAIDLALTENFLGGLGEFLLALETGEGQLVDFARERLLLGFEISSALNMVPQWWCFRLAIHLLNDLWTASFHVALPSVPPEGNVASWQQLRRLFMAQLSRRRRAEIELWPSQLEAAKRAVDIHDDLVVSLPTSAGKTRVAELCILRCLSEGMRVVFVTPLRALSAQTETSLQRTFSPLGKTISTLYGSIGTSGFEEDALRTRNIVVATPEKLDFALRNDPGLIDDVGLIVLDEGHMIGLGEREVRYEVQIQRLLKRPDAEQRRIVCLSAILPEGNQLDDFVSWLKRDQPGGVVTADWRPTRVRFGEVLWRGRRGRLEFRIDGEETFVPTFLSPKAPTKSRRKKLFPNDQRELVLATAWRLVEEGQSVLIYCPQRRSVEPVADLIVDLHEKRGLLDSVLDADPKQLHTALTIGSEWLGEDHAILTCLKLGVAIHHGALPTPFRKEVERLLREGILKITVSSPTLAQGLNLTATTVIFFSLDRFNTETGKIEKIPTSEFKNVIGRAGRAFIDVEGLVLYPIFDNHEYKTEQWHELIDKSDLSIESGLFRLLVTLLQRLRIALGRPTYDQMLDYLMNNAAGWDFPEIKGEEEEEQILKRKNWNKYITILDTAILSILGEHECDEAEIAAKLDDLLSCSLWSRRLMRRNEKVQNLFKKALEIRARKIWSSSTVLQRKGYFLAGVGLGPGHQLDAAAEEANQLLVQANGAILSDDADAAINAITALAETLFEIPPFVPDPFPDEWRAVLRKWLEGLPIGGGEHGNTSDVLRFVENGLIYRLPWGMEALRVRALANHDTVGDFSFDDFELGLAVPAVETGTLNRSAALLMQAGFTSRLAAIKAVKDTEADFSSARSLAEWLKSGRVATRTEDETWPTIETASLWRSFVRNYALPEKQVWSEKSASVAVEWHEDTPAPRSVVKIHHVPNRATLILSPAYRVLGHLLTPFAHPPSGLVTAVAGASPGSVQITYYGPDDLSFEN